MKSIKVGKINVELIWFDSMGAKSSSFLVETPDVKILVDPGAAIMQPSYPLSPAEKSRLRNKALEEILEASEKAGLIFISHYHYDHHTLPYEANKLYENKTLWIKNPNLWINYSQWKRSRKFLTQLLSLLEGKGLNELYCNFQKVTVDSVEENISLALNKDFGEYQERKKELIRKGKRWLKKMKLHWRRNTSLGEFSGKHVKVRYADGKSFSIGSTEIKFTPPLFHGIEYDRLGWVVGLIVKHGESRILYTSDLQGPIIEDYAEWIIKENPDILIIDGPATYLLGYLLNQINLDRAINNICLILEKIKPRVIIYDHHLTRDFRFQERVAKVYTLAKEKKQNLLTFAEFLGKKPLILTLKNV